METFKKLKTFPKIINELEFDPMFSELKPIGWEAYKMSRLWQISCLCFPHITAISKILNEIM